MRRRSAAISYSSRNSLSSAVITLRPSMPILHVVHSVHPPHATPHDVLVLQEPFTPNQLLLVVGSLMA